jgi:hypothetical protein
VTMESSSFVDERPKGLSIDLKLDALPMRLSGFAASRGQEGRAEDLMPCLMLGSMLLGTIRRDQPRPEMASESGEPPPPIGFDVPDFGLTAFAAITGLGDLGITVETDQDHRFKFTLDSSSQNRSCAPLGLRHKGSLGFRLADAWLESSRNLSLRFEADPKTAKTVDAYQCAFNTLVSVAAERPIGGLASLVTFTLINPFAPVLLVFKDHDGSIDAIDFLPFPSLLRGGLHAAERLILGGGAEDVADAAAMSAQLVAAWLQRLERPARCVTNILIDPSIQTGLEPVLNGDLLSWMNDGLGIGVRVGDCAPEIPQFIAEALASYSSSTSVSGHTLHLPADCIPTISALLRPLPSSAAAELVSGAMGIVDWNRHGRVWSVWQPPFMNRIEGLQFSEAMQFAPALAVSGESAAAEQREIRLDWPLALAFREQPMRIARNNPFEIASDFGGALLRKGTRSEPRAVSVLVLCDPGSSDPLPLLESLTRQDEIRVADVVICRSDPDENTELTERLGQLFGERHRIVQVPATAGRLEQIVAARNYLAEQIVFVSAAATVLADPRTISTLTGMLEEPDVASVGCLVRAADEKMTALCAGYSFAQIDLRGMPGISFGAIDPAIWRGPSTYPVVANPLASMVTRSELLAELDADGSTAVQPETDDLLFGIQLIKRGGINLCTTIVSVYGKAATERLWPATVSIPYRLCAEDLTSIAERSTTVQRVA